MIEMRFVFLPGWRLSWNQWRVDHHNQTRKQCPHPIHASVWLNSWFTFWLSGKEPRGAQVSQELCRSKTPPPARAPNSHKVPTCREYHMFFVTNESRRKADGVGWVSGGGWMRRSGAPDTFTQGDACRLSVYSGLHNCPWCPKLTRRLCWYKFGTSVKTHLKSQDEFRREETRRSQMSIFALRNYHPCGI